MRTGPQGRALWVCAVLVLAACGGGSERDGGSAPARDAARLDAVVALDAAPVCGEGGCDAGGCVGAECGDAAACEGDGGDCGSDAAACDGDCGSDARACDGDGDCDNADGSNSDGGAGDANDGAASDGANDCDTGNGGIDCDAGAGDAGAGDADLSDADDTDGTAGDAIPSDGDTSDSGALDAGAGDAFVADAFAPDARADVGFPDSGLFPRDAGRWVATSTLALPAEVTRTGTGGVLLRGTVLAPQGAIEGEVLVVGDTIACVASDCSSSPGFGAATIVETRGVISPGLVDGHNHLAYDFLPDWAPVPFTFYANRYQWANDPSYEAFVAPYANHRSTGTHFCPAAKWGELRAIVHGTTTIQGQSLPQSCIDRLARNAESFNRLGTDHMQTNIGSIRDLNDADRMRLVMNFQAGSTTRYAVHMAEGYAGNNVDREFASYAGRDTRTVDLFRDPSGTPYRTAILIHALGLTDAEIDEAAMVGAYVVWSPSSNLVLYDRTANIQRMLDQGMVIGIGPDWTLSGEDDVLAEMRIAAWYGATAAIPALTPRRVWQMATSDGAAVVGLQRFVGRLEPGLRADIAVFGRRGPDPYAAVIDSGASTVRLVMIDGRAYYGDAALSTLAINAQCDPLLACGAPKFLCAAGTPGSTNRAGETVADIRAQLFNILEGIGFPANEQYGRGAQLLELAECP